MSWRRVAVFAALVTSGVCSPADAPTGWTKLQRQVLAWLEPIGNAGGGCGPPPASPCNITAIAEACTNASSVALAPVPCEWSALLPNTYILGCPASTIHSAFPHARDSVSCVSCQPFGCFANAAEAQAACVANPACGGITSEIGGSPWELRSLAHTAPSPTNESTFVITNQAACGHTPPPPPPGSGCNAFDTNGNLYSWCATG